MQSRVDLCSVIQGPCKSLKEMDAVAARMDGICGLLGHSQTNRDGRPSLVWKGNEHL